MFEYFGARNVLAVGIKRRCRWGICLLTSLVWAWMSLGGAPDCQVFVRDWNSTLGASFTNNHRIGGGGMHGMAVNTMNYI